MDRAQLADELQCPISLELLCDPVSLPCCGRACSRAALVASRESAPGVPSCPLCRTPYEVHSFDPAEASRNRSLQDIISMLSRPSPPTSPADMTPLPPLQFDAAPTVSAAYTLLPLPSTVADDVCRIARLQIRITNAPSLGLRRVLAVLLVDQSGSMSGSPWKQVSTALKHIVAMSRDPHLSHVQLAVAMYQSTATVLPTDGPLQCVLDRIDQTRAGGGTSFRAAFTAASDAIRRVAASPDTSPQNINIVFMTDGQASEARAGLAEELGAQLTRLRASLAETYPDSAPPDVTVHSVGFSGNCDRTLLEQIREAGIHRGQYRYAEPGDTEDALCARLTGLFEMIGAHGGCDVRVASVMSLSTGAAPWRYLGADGEELCDSTAVTLQLRTKPDGTGTATAWVAMPCKLSAGAVLPVAVTVVGGNASTTDDRPDYALLAEEDAEFAAVDAVRRAWVGVRIHRAADEAITLVREATERKPPMPPPAVRLAAAFLANRVRAVATIGSDAHDRVPALLAQLAALRAWGGAGDASAVSIARLQDISSASAFSSSRARVEASSPKSASPKASTGGYPQSHGRRPPSQAASTSLTTTATHQQRRDEPAPAHISPVGHDEDRNHLQQSIVEWVQCAGCGDNARTALAVCADVGSLHAVNARDSDGNTALHLCCAFGQSEVLSVFVEELGSLSRQLLNSKNAKGETPLTLAIKRRGYYRTIEALVDMGARIDEPQRYEGLVGYALKQGWTHTVALLERLHTEGRLVREAGDDEGGAEDTVAVQVGGSLPPLEIDDKMPLALVEARIKVAVAAGRDVLWPSVMRAALRECAVPLLQRAAEAMGNGDAAAQALDTEWVFAECFPRKADGPDIPARLDLIGNALQILRAGSTAPRLVASSSGDTLLHRSVEKGSLPHCEFSVDKAGVWVDEQNNKGNTALYVACAKKYPCIVDYLLGVGADVNLANHKGMVPLGAAVQMGATRIVEQLLSTGARLDGEALITTRGDTLVHLAARNNQPSILALFLDRCDPDQLLYCAKIDGFNPLHAAVEGGYVECMTLLLDTAKLHAKRGVSGFAMYIDSTTASDGPVLPGCTAVHLAVHYARLLALTMLLKCGADVNNTACASGECMTPLHRAAQSRSAAAVQALMAHGANTTLRDRLGRTASAYARVDGAVTDALCGPLVVPLRDFAIGYGDTDVDVACAEVVRRAAEAAAEPGVLSAARVVDSALDDDGATAVQIAAAHGNASAVEVLVVVGADLAKQDEKEVSAIGWAQIAKSHRLADAVGGVLGDHLPATCRVLDVAKGRAGADAMAVFLAPRPKIAMQPTLASSVADRLAMFGVSVSVVGAEPLRALALLRGAPSRPALPDRIQLGADAGETAKQRLTLDVWAGKVATAHAVAGKVAAPCPSHLFALHVATRNGALLPAINDLMANAPVSEAYGDVPGAQRALVDFGVLLCDALAGLPLWANHGELYMAAPRSLSRQAVVPGTRVRTSGFVSAVPSWQSAVAAVDEFARRAAPAGSEVSEFGSGKGVVFIVTNSVTGRSVGCHGFADDGEVLFAPGATFLVQRWYVGDVVALGQANIRDRTFGIEGEDALARAAAGNRSVIIAMEEISSPACDTEGGK